MKKIVLCSVVFFCVFTFSQSSADTADPIGLNGTVWDRAAQKYHLDPYLLYAISLMESRRKYEDGLVRPTPFALHQNATYQSYYPVNRTEAEALLAEMLKKNNNIDVGIMQVNCLYHCDKVASVFDLLDPETNIFVAANILSFAINSTSDPIIGVGRYHHWGDVKRTRNYGTRVLRLVYELRKMGNKPS